MNLYFGMFSIAVANSDGPVSGTELETCLLYTSDAADDSLRVDLGGRRIIKKKFDPNHYIW